MHVYLCSGINIEIPRYVKKYISLCIQDRTPSHPRHTYPQGAATRPAIHGEGTSVYSIQLGSIISTTEVLSGMDPLIIAKKCWQTKWMDQCMNIMSGSMPNNDTPLCTICTILHAHHFFTIMMYDL